MPAELTGGGIAIAVAVALIAAFIRGLSGFGLALILVPVLALTVTPEQAVVAANALGVVMGLASIRGARAAAERSATSIALLAVVTTPVGLALLAVTPDQVARVVIALAALLAFAVVLRPRRAVAAAVAAPAGSAEPLAGAGPGLIRATGITSGLLAGFAGIPGPPVIAFYLGRAVAPAAARASMFIVFLATSISACIAALALGIADVTAGWLTILLAPAVLIGNWLGSRAFGRVSPLAWRLCAGGIVAGAALVALLRLI